MKIRADEHWFSSYGLEGGPIGGSNGGAVNARQGRGLGAYG